MNLSGGIDGLLALRQGAANYQYLYDGKGNTTVLDTTNPPVASYHYDVFGKLLRQSADHGPPERDACAVADEAADEGARQSAEESANDCADDDKKHK